MIEYDEKKGLTTIVPQSPSHTYPPELPPHVIDLLAAYELPDLGMVLAADAEWWDKEINPYDERLRGIRTKQAQCLEAYIKQTVTVLYQNYLFLGLLLIESLNRDLHTYLGYRSLDEWCQNMHVDRAMLHKAKQYAQVWPRVRELGLTPLEFTDGQIDDEKMPLLQTLLKQNNPLTHELAMYEELYGALDPTTLPAHMTPAKAMQRAINLLPQEKKEQLRDQAHAQYVQKVRSEVERIRANLFTDLLTNQEELRGIIRKPTIIHRCTLVGKHMHFEQGDFACGKAEILAMVSGQVIHYYTINDGPLMNAAQFGQYLLEITGEESERED